MTTDGTRRLPKPVLRVLNEILGFEPDYPQTVREWENIHSLIGCFPLNAFVKTHARNNFVDLGGSLGFECPMNKLLELCPNGADVDFLQTNEDDDEEEPESPFYDGTECLDFLVTPLSKKTGTPQKRKKFYIRVFPAVQ
jgi:hypothetical protein